MIRERSGGEACNIDLRIILGGTSRYIDSGITRPSMHFFVATLSFAYYSVACIHNFFLAESIKSRKTVTVSSSNTPMRSIKGENVIYGDIDLHTFILIAEFYSMRLYVHLRIYPLRSIRLSQV